MPNTHVRYLMSSVFRKQIVAVSGIVLVGFIIGHLAGNLLLLIGPEAFNTYADRLQSLGELLWVIRAGLLAALVLHVVFTILLYLENRRARGARAYVTYHTFGNTNFVRRTMVYSGLLAFFFLFLHISDFSLGDKVGPASVVPGAAGGESLGLYGLVWRSFLFREHWWRPLLYILAVVCVGAHLTHGAQSLFHTLGLTNTAYRPLLMRASVWLGVAVAAGFSLIPLYVNLIGTPRVP